MRFYVSLIRIACLAAIACVAVMPAHAAARASDSAPSPRCTAFASAPWVNGPTPRLKLEAFSDGPSCAKAVAVITIRNAAGSVLFSHSYIGEVLAPTSGVRTIVQMRAALNSWLQAGRDRSIHANLPNWVAGADEPVDTEFPFMPDETITRADYLAIKANRTPIVCYVQGMESLNCLVYRNGDMEPFGIQTFPG